MTNAYTEYVNRAIARAEAQLDPPKWVENMPGQWRVGAFEDPWNVGEYTLAVSAREDGAPIRVTCTCPSGKMRGQLPIACKHGAWVVVTLQRLGVKIVREHATGLYRWNRIPEPDPLPEDPFADLAPPDDWMVR